MPDYSLVPVDYQPDFGDYTLVPVDYNPFLEDGLVQQAPFQTPAPPTPTQPAQAQPQTQPQQPATGAVQPGVIAQATGNSSSGSGGGAGDTGTNRSNPTWAQGGAPAFTPRGGYANPTPTESLVNQAQKEAKKVQVDLIKANSNADRGSSDIHQKIVDRASAQIGSGGLAFRRGEGKFWSQYRQMQLVRV